MAAPTSGRHWSSADDCYRYYFCRIYCTLLPTDNPPPVSLSIRVYALYGRDRRILALLVVACLAGGPVSIVSYSRAFYGIVLHELIRLSSTRSLPAKMPPKRTSSQIWKGPHVCPPCLMISKYMVRHHSLLAAHTFLQSKICCDAMVLPVCNGCVTVRAYRCSHMGVPA
jgi:hypothetical protein